MQIMADSPITLQLRTLQTIDGLGPNPSNTVILFPAQLGELIQRFRNQHVPESD